MVALGGLVMVKRGQKWKLRPVVVKMTAEDQ
jgi:hypothetical protein